MLHVGGDFGSRERRQVIARDDALCELPQLAPLEQFREFGLADQNDLQQLAPVGFEVGEQAHLLQHVCGEILRLVDNQHRMPALRV